MRTVIVSVDRTPFQLTGIVIIGDTSGDASVIGGVEWFAPYVDEFSVKVGKVNVTEYLAASFYDEFCELLVEAARET